MVLHYIEGAKETRVASEVVEEGVKRVAIGVVGARLA